MTQLIKQRLYETLCWECESEVGIDYDMTDSENMILTVKELRHDMCADCGSMVFKVFENHYFWTMCWVSAVDTNYNYKIPSWEV